ncbi:MAG: hypothetical protein ACFFC6_10410 [Promethearchaeota archaeon]
MTEKLKAVEEWNTPIGSHEKKIFNNRDILNCLNTWFDVPTNGVVKKVACYIPSSY